MAFVTENSVNAFKRKLSLANEEAAKQKMAKLDESAKQSPTGAGNAESKEMTAADDVSEVNRNGNDEPPKAPETTETAQPAPLPNQTVTNMIVDEMVNSPLRRGSQESTATTTTQTTTTTTGTDSTSSSSSDSSSSDCSSSDSDDSSSEDENKVNIAYFYWEHRLTCALSGPQCTDDPSEHRKYLQNVHQELGGMRHTIPRALQIHLPLGSHIPECSRANQRR